MKVIRIVSELDFGGVEQVLANSLPELNRRKGVEVQVIVLGKGGRVAKQLMDQGIAVLVLGLNPRIPNFKLIKSLKKKILFINPDVVHCQGGEANFHGIIAAKISKVPKIIAEEIGIPNHHSFWKWIFRWVYSKASCVIAVADRVKKTIVDLGEVEKEKVFVVYNPVISSDSYREQFSVGSRQKGEDFSFIFITTCRLVPIKNLDRLIQAFAGLIKENPKRSLKLKIVGEGPERRNLESLRQKLEMDGIVEFFGFQEDVFPFLEEADAFILPSLSEGSPVSLAEAMSAGLPSIVTQVGGASEILGESNSGILINPLSVEHIQSAMQELVKLSEEGRLKMGERAKKEAKRFSRDHYVDSLLSIYAFSDFSLQNYG